MLAIVVHENMKLGDNTLNNERFSFVKKKKKSIEWFKKCSLICLSRPKCLQERLDAY